ncbi:MAG: hypothetical protein U9N18_07000 [Campylobacterota bacterium]|nr:hypothetical protein [Campylobacterota bacterium]
MDSLELSKSLISETKIAILSGFGLYEGGCVRFSCIENLDRMKEIVWRLQRTL